MSTDTKSTVLDMRNGLNEILLRSGMCPSRKMEFVELEAEEDEKGGDGVQLDDGSALPPSSSSASGVQFSSTPTFDQLSPLLNDSVLRMKLFQDVRVGDRICCRVLRATPFALELELVCMMSRFKRCFRFMDGEKFSVSYDRTKRVYSTNDYVAATVLQSDKSTCQLELVLNQGEAILETNDLPLYYRNSLEQSTYMMTYSECDVIRRMRRNPNLCELLTVRIDSESSALNSFSAESCSTRPIESAEELRRTQRRKLAMVHVTRGAELTREGKCFEAIQCFNKALNVDDTFADALVGRGAACAGNSNFPAALTDLEKATRLEPDHRNAKKYLVEVLIAFGKELEKEGNRKEALVKYEKALALSQGNERAMAGIKRLDGRRLVEVVDLSVEEGEEVTPIPPSSNGNGNSTGTRRISAVETPEVNRKKLRDMEEFIERLKRSK